MWGSVLALAFMAALEPVRLGITLLVISRPRPVQNLFALWAGSLTGCIPGLVVPLTVLNFTPMRGLATPATSSTVRHVQIGMGMFVLSIAALMAVRFLARQRAHQPIPGANTSTVVLDSNTPTAISRLLSRAQDAPMEGGSAIRRLLGRVHNGWENGSLWVSWVMGAWLAGPQPPDVVILLAVIAASGAAIGTQVSAAIVFVVGMLAVVEIVLVSHLAAPAKTQAVVREVHDWVLAHRRQVLVAIFAVIGVTLVANGMGMGMGSV
jgi:hypothetical protein